MMSIMEDSPIDQEGIKADIDQLQSLSLAFNSPTLYPTFAADNAKFLANFAEYAFILSQFSKDATGLLDYLQNHFMTNSVTILVEAIVVYGTV